MTTNNRLPSRLRQNPNLYGVLLGIPLLIVLRAGSLFAWAAVSPLQNSPALNRYLDSQWSTLVVRSLPMGAVLGCVSLALFLSWLEQDASRLRVATRGSCWLTLSLSLWSLCQIQDPLRAVRFIPLYSGSPTAVTWQHTTWLLLSRMGDVPLLWATGLLAAGVVCLRGLSHDQKQKRQLEGVSSLI